VFWSHSSGKFKVWKVDGSGEFQSQVTAHLWQHENTFKVDLNGDGIDSGNNDIYGSIGNDTFDGRAGDTLIGGEGNDWISGDGGSGYAGNDILFGNAGNDDLLGRGGNDQIDGGTGSDTITTGSGLDKIILRIGDGGNTLSDADIITDFTDGSDKLRLDDGLLFSQLTISQGDTGTPYANDTIISHETEYLAILQGIDVNLLSDADFGLIL
jgi:Ca2+-binding RTX toxin-like protein